MIAKISVGRGLRGSLDYDFSPAKSGEPRARLVAGTLAGTPRQMSQQAAPFRALRPDCKNPVWRCSLSLPPAERHLSDSDWQKIAQDFLHEMGVDLEKSAWCAVRHSDRVHNHIHISLLRIQSDGQLWDRAHDVPRAIAATARLEQRYGLLSHPRERAPRSPKPTQTENFSPSPTPQPPKKKGKKMSVISKIQSEVDVVLTAAGVGGMTLGELKKRLLLKKILLEEARTQHGKIMGFKYQDDGGAWISASQIGSAYGLGLAVRGVDFCEQSPPKSTPAATKSDDKADTKPSSSSQLARLSEWLESANPDPSAKQNPQAAKPNQKTNSPALPLRLSGHWHADVAIICNQIGLALAIALLSYLKRCLADEGIKVRVQVEEAFEERPWYVPLPKLGVKRLEITDLDGNQLDEERALQVDQIVAQTIESVTTGGNLPETASPEAANLLLEIEKEQVSNELDQIEEVQSKIRTSFPRGSEQEQSGNRSLLQILNLLLKKLLSIVQRQPLPQPCILGLSTARIEIESALKGGASEEFSNVLANSIFHPKFARDLYLAKTGSQLKKFMAENPPITDGGSGSSRDFDADDDEQEESYQPRM